MSLCHQKRLLYLPQRDDESALREKELQQRIQHRLEIRQREVRRGLEDTVGIKESEYNKLVSKSMFLQSLIDYEDKYIARKQKFERKCVLVDAVIINSIERISYYRMCKTNLINAILHFCINKHRKELVKFLKKNETLL